MKDNHYNVLKKVIIINLFFFGICAYSQERKDYEQLALDHYFEKIYSTTEKSYIIFNNSIQKADSLMTEICFKDYLEESLDKKEDTMEVVNNNYTLQVNKIKVRSKDSFFLKLFHKKRIKTLKVYNVVNFNNKMFVEISVTGYFGAEYHFFDFEKSTGKVLRHCVTEYVH